MPRLNPYLNFAGNAREAMEFYQAALGGDLRINTFAEFGFGDSDGVMHAYLETPSGFAIMASDLPPGMDPSPVGQNISISLSGEEADELRGYWEKLSQGATIVMPLEQQVWGDQYGQLVDQFGIPWMVNIVMPPAQA